MEEHKPELPEGAKEGEKPALPEGAGKDQQKGMSKGSQKGNRPDFSDGMKNGEKPGMNNGEHPDLLKDLLNDGVITQEEYDALSSAMDAAAPAGQNADGQNVNAAQPATAGSEAASDTDNNEAA